MKTLVVRDSRLPGVGPHDESKMVVPDGPASVTYQSVTPADPTSLNPIFSIDLPSQMTGLQRQLYWNMTGSFTVTGTALNTFQAAERVALRAFALQSMCSSVELQMNDTTLNIGSLNQIIDALLRIGNPSGDAADTQSAAPATMDTVSAYEDVVGRLDSPFRAVGDREVSSAAGCPRTVGITGITVDGTFTTMTVNFTIREPIIVPPFSYTDAGREKALYGLNQVQVKANLTQFSRGLSLAIPAGATVTAITMAPTAQSLSCVFVTPNDRSMALARASSRIFRYDAPRVQSFFTTVGGTVNAGASATANSNSFQLAVVPEKILVFVVPSEADRTDPTQSLPSAFCPITSCQIQAGTRGGLLSGANTVDLWAMSNRNGASIPFWQYEAAAQVSSTNTGANQASGSGGPLVLDVAADLSLPDGVVPGQAMNWTFAVTSLTFTNRFAINLTNARIVIMAITPGVLTNKGGASSVCIGGVPLKLDSKTVAEASEMTSEDYHRLQDQGGFGGSKFTDWLWKAGDAIKHSAYKTGDAIKHAAWKAGDAIKHEAWKAGDGIKHTAYALGDDVLSAAHEAAHSAAQAAVQASAHGAGGRRMPAAMLYQ